MKRRGIKLASTPTVSTPLIGGITPLKTETVESVLRQVVIPENGEFSRLLTNDQVNLLVDLQWQREPSKDASESKRDGPMFNLENRAFIYEVIGLIQRLGFDQVYRYLDRIRTDKTATDNEIIFDNVLMKRPKAQYLADAERLRTEIKVKEGEECPKCKGNNTLSVRVQLRSADEPMSLLGECLDCGNKWREN